MIGLPQRRVGQPYTMCHALRLVDRHVDCGRLATPAFGTNYALDHPEVLIKLCLTAPRQVQLAARLQGITNVIHIRVPGLAEALERSRAGVQDSQGVILSPKARTALERSKAGRKQ